MIIERLLLSVDLSLFLCRCKEKDRSEFIKVPLPSDPMMTTATDGGGI